MTDSPMTRAQRAEMAALSRRRAKRAVEDLNRRVAQVAAQRIAAATATGKRRIEAQSVEIETELVREGLTSERGAAFLAALPSASDLLAGVVLDLPEVPAWTPTADAVADLLTTGTGRTREAKRRQVLATLAANPVASDREVARLASVDHKTVARIRGEVTAQAGENPHNAGEVTA